jgi:hypothetical protein
MAAITLMVSFDIDQESEQLNWSFLDAEGRPIVRPKGQETGTIAFKAGDAIALQVVAYSYKKALRGAHIIDCHLMTRPLLYSKRQNPEFAGEYPYPSPFFNPATQLDGQGATASFGNGATAGTPSRMSWSSPVVMLCLNEGRWDTSFIMTVAIETADGLDYRVFAFDPECQVGTGAMP